MILSQDVNHAQLELQGIDSSVHATVRVIVRVTGVKPLATIVVHFIEQPGAIIVTQTCPPPYFQRNAQRGLLCGRRRGLPRVLARQGSMASTVASIIFESCTFAANEFGGDSRMALS